jgi:hypothetical protein
MKPFIVAALILSAALAPVFAADAPASASAPPPAKQAAADVSMLVAWIAGADDKRVAEKPFADHEFITDRKGAIFYTDVADVTVPKALRQVPYDFIKPRMEMIQNGHKASPAVLITRSVAEEPEDARFGKQDAAVHKANPGARYYYIEVAIGNMAWHWIKVAVYEQNGKTRVQFLHSAVS